MIKLTKILLTLVVSMLIFASCIKSDEVETSPECAIITFSVSDIKSGVVVHRSSGVDTTITKTISGSSIYFNIDQVNGKIYNVDSIANWVDLTKVVPKFTSYGTVYGRVYGDSLYYKWTSGSDSLSFEKPVDVFVLSTDGKSTKQYTIAINRSAYSLDTINWSAVNSDINITNDFKTLELNNFVYAFSNDANGGLQVTNSSVNTGLTKWSTTQTVEGAQLDYASVLIFKNEFYALSTDGHIYKINTESTPYAAEKVSDETFTQLLASDSFFIYTTDGKQILASEDFSSWSCAGNTDVDMLPTSNYMSCSYESKTNSNIQICMMNGLSANNSSNGVSWYKVSSKKEDVNQNWMYIQVTDDNSFGLPHLKNLSSTLMNNKIYAIGVNSDDTYDNIYESDDNGITWHEKDIYPVPTDLNAANGSANIISADDKLWIIQKGGNIWSGVIR